MQLFLQTSLSFAFVVAVLGQGYVGRQRTPVVDKKPIGPVVVDGPFTDPFGGGIDALRGGGMVGMPDHIKRIIGSTVTGDILVGGMGDLPRHGGTLNENGLVDGWGSDPNIPIIPAVSMWSDPLNGGAFPHNYNGEELVFDPVLNRYVVKPGAIGHQIAKETHVASGVIGVPTSHGTMKAEHNIVKESSHIAAKTAVGVFGPVGHMGVDPVSHSIDKQINGGAGFIQPGSFGPIGMDPIGHDIAKSQVHHDVAKSGGIVPRPIVGTHVGVSELGTVNAGKVGVHDPGFIAHNIGKATLGADAVHGHNIAKNSGVPRTVGFIDPTGPVAQSMGVDPFVGHDIAIGSTGVGFVSGPGFVRDPVHEVNKVGRSGMAQVGHDPLAASMGHGIAKQTVAEASRIVDIGSKGGVSAGDPVAAAATHGLAKESIHVAGKTLDMAGGRPLGVGMDIFGPGGPVVHPPVKKPPTFPTGYGRRVH